MTNSTLNIICSCSFLSLCILYYLKSVTLKYYTKYCESQKNLILTQDILNTKILELQEELETLKKHLD